MKNKAIECPIAARKFDALLTDIKKEYNFDFLSYIELNWETVETRSIANVVGAEELFLILSTTQLILQH